MTDGELHGLLADLAPDRRGERAFATLERVWPTRPSATVPFFMQRLYELSSLPANRNRSLLVHLIAGIARSHRHTWPAARLPALTECLRAGVPLLTTFIADPDPLVRRVAPYAICEILTGEPGPAGPIREQAAAEDDPLALAGQVRALDELGHAAPPGSTPVAWFASWLPHPSPEVRMAAVGALARRGAGPDGAGAGLGTVAAEAVTAAGTLAWTGSPWRPRQGHASVLWLAKRLAGHPHEGERLALAAFADGTEQVRWGAAPAAAAVLHRWRRPLPRLWAALADGLRDPSELVRRHCAEVLATGGAAVRPHAEQLLAVAERDETPTGLHAVAALAGLGDPRVLPALTRWIGATTSWPRTIAPDDLLVPFREHAGALLRTIRAVLRRDPWDCRPHLAALAAWGAAAASAVPELVALLDTRHAARACAVLGRIGPGAATAAEVLERLATGRRHPKAHSSAWPGTQDAAWAHWRVTGEPGVALAVIGRAVRRGPGRAMLPYLADLGLLAAAHAENVRRLLDVPGGWTRTEAAHAWWRITGDPAPAVPVLCAVIEPLRRRESSAVIRAAVRHLGAIGAAAAGALPLLDDVLAGDRRTVDPRGRHAILDDDALVGAARSTRDGLQSA
ncbi:hypothetical protein ABT369_30335 [Dactylosporangium sp. NPDC000244]|uniref:hypothetical protein n=1 Tax=Dactylosporangium sp. NPDC000244 TaxID=3154365 RepID=UPI00332F683F